MTEQKTLTKTQIQKLTVRSADRIRYVKTLLELGAKGATLAEGTVPKMIVPFQSDLVLEINDPSEALKSTPDLIAYPVEYEVYTKYDLEEMVWLDFREACATQGVKGRDREKMLEDYLKVVQIKGKM